MVNLKCIALVAMLLTGFMSCEKETTQNPISSDGPAVSASNRRGASYLGRQEIITVPTGDYTYPTSQALLWLPGVYSKEDMEDVCYPLIIALDGVGENNSDINSLLHDGTLATRIANGWNPKARNPLNNRMYKFIVFTPQCPVNWGWSAPHIKTMLATLKQTYRIDTTRIYITGYSAGAWGLWSCITDDESLCSQFAAICPVSTASADHPDKITNVAKYGIACWNICGTADAFYTNAVNYTNIINNANPPVKAILSSLQGVGHSAWYQAYDTAWRDNGKNFFEWALQYHK